MHPYRSIALAAFTGFMVTAASTANDRVEQPSAATPTATVIQAAASTSVRIPDPIPLPSTRPAPKIVVDLK